MKKRILFISLIVFLFLSFSSLLSEESPGYKLVPDNLKGLDRVFVNYVYDGDTIRIAGGERVRLIGVDTPEMNWEEGEREYFAREAFEYSRDTLLNTHVYLEYDQEERDNYGRLLAYLFLEDGRFYNKILLEKGYAGLMLIPPNLKYEALFKKTAAEARRSSRGVWQWVLADEVARINWQQVAYYLGQEVLVRGEILNTFETEQIIFLEYSEGGDSLELVIFKDDLIKFDYDPVEFLAGKELMVRGVIEKYRDMLEIVIGSPQQIYIIRDN